MQLHQWLAVGYFALNSVDYQCTASESRVMSNWEKGLELVGELGEYNIGVSRFYCEMGRYYLVVREPVQGLMYLNKSLLIVKSIHTD